MLLSINFWWVGQSYSGFEDSLGGDKKFKWVEGQFGQLVELHNKDTTFALYTGRRKGLIRFGSFKVYFGQF